MRYRKFLLGLPESHCWMPEDWMKFEKLDKRELAEELKAPLEQVESLFPEQEDDRYMQEALPMPDFLIESFVMSFKPWMRNAQLYASIFQQLFGRQAVSA